MPIDDPLVDQMRADFLGFDLLETITFRSRDVDTGAYTDYDDITALARRGETKVEGLHGETEAFTNALIFHFPVDEDDAYTVKKRDRVERDDGSQWVILKVEKQSADTRWRVTCLKALNT